MDKVKSNIMVEFSIYGEGFEPCIISEELNVEPSETHIKGTTIKGKKICWKETAWVISTGYEISMDINEQLNKIFKKLEGKEEKLIKIKNDLNVKMLIMIVVNIENKEPPAMYFRNHIIHFLSNIDAEVGFDVYVYS